MQRLRKWSGGRAMSRSLASTSGESTACSSKGIRSRLPMGARSSSGRGEMHRMVPVGSGKGRREGAWFPWAPERAQERGRVSPGPPKEQKGGSMVPLGPRKSTGEGAWFPWAPGKSTREGGQASPGPPREQKGGSMGRAWRSLVALQGPVSSSAAPLTLPGALSSIPACRSSSLLGFSFSCLCALCPEAAKPCTAVNSSPRLQGTEERRGPGAPPPLDHSNTIAQIGGGDMPGSESLVW